MFASNFLQVSICCCIVCHRFSSNLHVFSLSNLNICYNAEEVHCISHSPKLLCLLWSVTTRGPLCRAVVLKLWYARAFQVVREQLSCHIRKALLIRFCVIIRSCVMLTLLIRLFPILILSTFERITFFWNQGVYTPTSKKHQVVRDLKKFENHWCRRFPTLNWS